MSSATNEFEQTRLEMAKLIASHKRTRTWFWRTGISSLAAAGLWLIMYNSISENARVKETLAILIGAALMWILFLWAFLLLRKLNRLTWKIKGLERKIDAILQTGHPPSDTLQQE
jgi:hypothetical protein